MLTEFNKDLEAARGAEYLVLQELSKRDKSIQFQWVGDQPEYYYKGDIIATAADGKQYFIEVKNDSRIADTYNVLCEDEVYYKKSGYFGKGGMYNTTDIYCVVSEQQKKIYVIDFKVLQSNYRNYEFKIIRHKDQDTYAYFMPIGKIRKYGGLLATIEY